MITLQIEKAGVCIKKYFTCKREINEYISEKILPFYTHKITYLYIGSAERYIKRVYKEEGGITITLIVY